MSEFWESFEAGADAGIETMGVKVTIGGVEVDAVPDGLDLNELVSTGGKKKDVSFTLQVSVAVGDSVGDGDLVEYRTVRGRVNKKDFTGGGWILFVGPENRWDGEMD